MENKSKVSHTESRDKLIVMMSNILNSNSTSAIYEIY